MTKFTTKTAVGSLIIEDVAVGQSDKWKVVQDERYRPDKQKFVEEAFAKEFPQIKATDFDTISALCSRSKTLGAWLANTNALYALSVQPPLYLQNLIKPQDFTEIQGKLTSLNRIAASEAAEILKLSAQYDTDLKAIRDRSEAERKQYIDDKRVQILALNATDLPATIQLAIQGYTGAKSGKISQATYAREWLVNYKVALIQAVDKFPDLDITTLVAELATK